MVYTRFVEYGRLVSVEFGKYTGKLAVITNILDIKAVQIQGAEVPRQVVPINHVVLMAQVKPTKTAISKADADGVFKELYAEYEKTECGKKEAARKLRASLNDFQRYTALSLVRQRDAKIAEICKHRAK